MKTVSINTTQNVKIEYDLANWGERVIAFLVDFIVLIIGALIFYYTLNDSMYLMYFITTPFVLFFSLTFEVFNDGQTLGKMMMKIRVVKLNAKQVKLSDYLMRWCFRPFDIWVTSGVLASFLVSTSKFNQRLGDMLANTTVIKLSPRNPLKLTDVLSIKTIKDYQPVYTAVTKLREQDIVLAKTTLDDFQKYHNQAHAESVDLITDKLMQLMEMKEHEHPTNIDFLKTLIKDYIVLTR